MTLSAKAQEMMDTLPDYYRGEPLVERIIQAWANEVDRQDRVLDQIEVELQPGAATDELGLLPLWESTLGLPARPSGATVVQRRGKVLAALRKLDSGSSADALSTIVAAMGETPFAVYRDTPDVLSDTLEIPFMSGTYNAGLIQSLALRIWPAHRRLYMRYLDGFLADVSRTDEDTV